MTQNVFRGWWVLAGLILIYATTNGILTYSLPLMHPELMAEFAWSESTVTLPATVFFIVTAFTSPPAGVLLDRFSPRVIIGFGLGGIVLGLAAYSQITQLGQLIAVYVLLGTSLSLCGLASNMVILTRWFDQYRGRATGLLLMASSLGGVLFPQLLGQSIQRYGWREAMLILAVSTAAIAVVPLVTLVRNSPQTFGLLPDGHVKKHVSKQKQATRQGPTLLGAVGESKFYLVAVATAGVWFCIIAMLQHQPIYLIRDLGFDKALFPSVMSVFALCSVFGKLTFGYLSDRLDKYSTMILAVCALSMALLLLRSLDEGDTALTFLYAIIAGLGFSGAFTMTQVLIAKLYAGLSYGKILGTYVLLDSLGGALGNHVVGKMRGTFDSYLPAIDLLIGVCVLTIGSIVILKRISPSQATTSELSGESV